MFVIKTNNALAMALQAHWVLLKMYVIKIRSQIYFFKKKKKKG